MTVKQAIEDLQRMPADAELVLWDAMDCDYKKAVQFESRKAKFYLGESPNEADYFILSDEKKPGKKVVCIYS